MAIAHRGPPVTLHSDQGLNVRHRKLPGNRQPHGIRQSMSRKGNCWDTQSTMALNDRPSLTRAGIGQCLGVDLSTAARRSPRVAGPLVCDLIGALFCTVSVLSCERVGNASLRMQEDRMSHLTEEREVILGVDTHLDVHVAVLIDVVGRIVATTFVSDDGSGTNN